MSQDESTELVHEAPDAPVQASPDFADGGPEFRVPDEGSAAWRSTMVDVMRTVLLKLPDETSLGDIVEAARSNPNIAAGLRALSIQELIEIAVERPQFVEIPDEDELLADEFDAGPAVIRRRADIPDGDIKLLTILANKGPQSEAQLCRAARINSEQLRLILRGLQTKSYIHLEGSGKKRKIKITRNGGGYLRKKTGDPKAGRSGRRRRR